MIKGKTPQEYYSTEIDSSSSLKEFSFDRRKYFKKYVEKSKVEDDEKSQAMIIGDLVDCLLLTPNEFDSKFCMSCLHKAPTAGMLAFVEALYKHTINNPNNTFAENAKLAYVDSGYKISFEKVIEKFNGSDAEIYYKEILDIRQKGLTVVTVSDIENAERIILELKTNEFTAPIINRESDENYNVYNQLQIEGYELDGLLLKSMIDKVIVNHINKTIDIYDLKCVYSVEGFYKDYYLYRRAYIQAYLYYNAVKFWKKIIELDDYTVNYPNFLVCDSISYFSSLIYSLYGSDIGEAYDGFDFQGKYYPGVKDIIKDLRFAKSNNIWKISRKNYENEGIVRLK